MRDELGELIGRDPNGRRLLREYGGMNRLPASPGEVRRWAGFDADEPHEARTCCSVYCELCGRLVSDRVHDV